ncbi:hypothetical protein NL676_005139 [Syzygium grande]|nr:hypothetical protein NL676_005139 [Syzygium grande]
MGRTPKPKSSELYGPKKPKAAERETEREGSKSNLVYCRRGKKEVPWLTERFGRQPCLGHVARRGPWIGIAVGAPHPAPPTVPGESEENAVPVRMFLVIARFDNPPSSSIFKIPTCRYWFGDDTAAAPFF